MMNQITNKAKDIDTLAPLPVNNGLPSFAQNEPDTNVLKAMWGLNAGAMAEVLNIGKVYNSKHGLFASVPIICRSTACPYLNTCMVKASERKNGQRCPMEIAAIMSRFTQYCQHFEIDLNIGIIEPENLVDVTLIKDLVTIEVAMMRAENKIALNGDFMATTLLDIDKKCNPYFGQIIAPEQEHLLSLQDKKTKILNQLNATRKDKIKEKDNKSPSDEAIKIFQMLQREAKQEGVSISDMEFTDDVENLEEDNVELEGSLDGSDQTGVEDDSEGY